MMNSCLSFIIAVSSFFIVNCSEETSGKKWLFMLYMDGDNNLERCALLDINRIENSLSKLSSSTQNNIRIIALVDRHEEYDISNDDWKGARIYELQADSVDSRGEIISTLKTGWWDTDETELNMGNPDTLNNFINYCLNNYPGYEHKWLMLWNHGSGVRAGMCFDDSHDKDSLHIDEIQQVLTAHFNGTDKLDVLHLQGCLMGMVEVAYEFRNIADYMTACPHIGGAGPPFFQHLFDNISDTMTPEELATLTVKKYKETWIVESPRYRAITAVDLVEPEKMENLKNKIDILAQKMYQENKQTAIEAVRDSSLDYYSDLRRFVSTRSVIDVSQAYPYYELGDFCNKIIADSSFSSTLKDAAGDVLAALGEVVLYAWADINKGNYEGYGSNIKRGLSIVFPRVGLTYHSDPNSDNGYSYYSYQWWYTQLDESARKPGRYYGRIDFCTSDTDNVVETWRELFEAWYDQSAVVDGDKIH